MDYRNLVLYAEGIIPKGKDVEWRILHSASVEFECIDQIYEANIHADKIKDAAGDIAYFVNVLKSQDHIVNEPPNKYTETQFWPAGIVAGNIRSYNGNTLFMCWMIMKQRYKIGKNARLD